MKNSALQTVGKYLPNRESAYNPNSAFQTGDPWLKFLKSTSHLTL
jgi:hypothetical protein